MDHGVGTTLAAQSWQIATFARLGVPAGLAGASWVHRGLGHGNAGLEPGGLVDDHAEDPDPKA